MSYADGSADQPPAANGAFRSDTCGDILCKGTLLCRAGESGEDMQQDRGEISMGGRICLITGATSGIGLVTARELAARGATVAIVGRNETKTRATVEAIRQQTGNA